MIDVKFVCYTGLGRPANLGDEDDDDGEPQNTKLKLLAIDVLSRFV
jgi:hypothetical protein